MHPSFRETRIYELFYPSRCEDIIFKLKSGPFVFWLWRGKRVGPSSAQLQDWVNQEARPPSWGNPGFCQHKATVKLEVKLSYGKGSPLPMFQAWVLLLGTEALRCYTTRCATSSKDAGGCTRDARASLAVDLVSQYIPLCT